MLAVWYNWAYGYREALRCIDWPTGSGPLVLEISIFFLFAMFFKNKSIIVPAIIN
jgi:hypothetical protein